VFTRVERHAAGNHAWIHTQILSHIHTGSKTNKVQPVHEVSDRRSTISTFAASATSCQTRANCLETSFHGSAQSNSSKSAFITTNFPGVDPYKVANKELISSSHMSVRSSTTHAAKGFRGGVDVCENTSKEVGMYIPNQPPCSSEVQVDEPKELYTGMKPSEQLTTQLHQFSSDSENDSFTRKDCEKQQNPAPSAPGEHNLDLTIAAGDFNDRFPVKTTATTTETSTAMIKPGTQSREEKTLPGVFSDTDYPAEHYPAESVRPESLWDTGGPETLAESSRVVRQRAPAALDTGICMDNILSPVLSDASTPQPTSAGDKIKSAATAEPINARGEIKSARALASARRGMATMYARRPPAVDTRENCAPRTDAPSAGDKNTARVDKSLRTSTGIVIKKELGSVLEAYCCVAALGQGCHLDKNFHTRFKHGLEDASVKSVLFISQPLTAGASKRLFQMFFFLAGILHLLPVLGFLLEVGQSSAVWPITQYRHFQYTNLLARNGSTATTTGVKQFGLIQSNGCVDLAQSSYYASPVAHQESGSSITISYAQNVDLHGWFLDFDADSEGTSYFEVYASTRETLTGRTAGVRAEEDAWHLIGTPVWWLNVEHKDVIDFVSRPSIFTSLRADELPQQGRMIFDPRPAWIWVGYSSVKNLMLAAGSLGYAFAGMLGRPVAARLAFGLGHTGAICTCIMTAIACALNGSKLQCAEVVITAIPMLFVIFGVVYESKGLHAWFLCGLAEIFTEICVSAMYQRTSSPRVPYYGIADLVMFGLIMVGRWSALKDSRRLIHADQVCGALHSGACVCMHACFYMHAYVCPFLQECFVTSISSYIHTYTYMHTYRKGMQLFGAKNWRQMKGKCAYNTLKKVRSSRSCSRSCYLY
jgi:hypothetical protein